MKNNYGKTRIAIAVSGVIGTFGVTAPLTADAVHISPQGTGQVLIYPYYTVRTAGAQAFSTSLSVVNASNDTKALKVRFREGKRHALVQTFNLFLAPRDTWTSGIVATAQGARLITNDNSCVTPSDLFVRAGALNEFKNFAYTGTGADGGPADLDRTREGYIEVIEMGVVTDTILAGYIRPGSNGIPANCAALDQFDPQAGGTNVLPGNFLAPPKGGLNGRALVISAATGASYGFDAVALEQWSDKVQYTSTGASGPALGDASPAVSNVMTPAGVVRATWSNGRDAVSAALIRAAVNNEFGLDNVTASRTDWVVTFPTKSEYVQIGSGAATVPFSNNFNGADNVGACDAYQVNIRNREAGTIGTPPAPPPERTCWGTTLIPFGPTSLTGSINTSGLNSNNFNFVNGATTNGGPATNLPGAQGPNGWFEMAFNNASVQKLTPISATLNGVAMTSGAHYGLPVISLSLQSFNNSGVTSQYAIVQQAKYTTKIDP